MRFCKGGTLRNKPLITNHNQPIEFVIEFVYLGVKLQTNLNPKKHLQHLVYKAIVATNSLPTKLNFSKITLNSAICLFNAIIIPAASYGRRIFGQRISIDIWEDHKKKICSVFYKKWAAIPRRLPTMPLIDEIFGPNPLDLNRNTLRNRAVIAMYNSNGCRHVLCVNGSCFYVNERRIERRCIFCQQYIHTKGHICICPSIPGTFLMDRLRNLIFSSVKPNLERLPETELSRNLMYWCKPLMILMQAFEFVIIVVLIISHSNDV